MSGWGQYPESGYGQQQGGQQQSYSAQGQQRVNTRTYIRWKMHLIQSSLSSAFSRCHREFVASMNVDGREPVTLMSGYTYGQSS